jgi:hypothetical protein
MRTLLAYGVRFGVSCTDSRLLERATDYLPPLTRTVRGGSEEAVFTLTANRRRLFTLQLDDAETCRAGTEEQILDRFARDVQLFVAERAPRRIFVHAGVVTWNGRAILLPGRSYSGKSTFVVELIRRGAVYYSDEYAVLDDRGRVHPYPRLISLRGSKTDHPSQRHHAQSFGARTGTRPADVALVLLTRFHPNGRWNPRRLSPGEGALQLLAQTVAARRAPQRALTAIQQVVLHAPVLTTRRGEAAETAALLFDRLLSE